MARLTIPRQELMHSGHAGCPGCGAALAMRYLLKGLGSNILIALPACCWTVIGTPFPTSVLDVGILDTAFETTGAAMSGLRAAADALKIEGVTVVGWAGDGGTVDIGIQALSGMLERRTDGIYVMYDNEAYMNTGIQRSGATPEGAWTTTTPVGARSRGKSEPKKDIMGIVAAHYPAYAATLNVAFPEDFLKKVQKARDIPGPRFLHVLAPCPPGWKYPPEKTIALGRLATDANVFPLYEIEGGKYRITRKLGAAKPVAEYLKLQGRFVHMRPEEVAETQTQVDARWKRLVALEAL
ncbi:MAG: thiamine pyrophosphate-dependent enzyme, partial [Candidatus Thermoplasmatota archaeon]